MAELLIESCPPSARADAIQNLFSRAGQAEFRNVYERVYTVRERLGLRSWVGMLGDEAILHISVSPQPFSDGELVLHGGLLGDLMADDSRRDFWGPLKLARRMVADVRRDAAMDFLLTSYLPAAEAVFRASGFKSFGVLRRLALPLVWPYPTIRRLQHRQHVSRLTARPYGGDDIYPLLEELRSPGGFRPVPSREYFTTRMPRIEYPIGSWLLAGDTSAPEAAVLVAPKEHGVLVVADVLWRNESPGLAGLFSGVARWAARTGHRRLSLTVMEESCLWVAARCAGFLPRSDSYPIMVQSIRHPEPLPASPRWAITPFALTAW